MVFCSAAGTLKDPDNLLREFARYVEKAGVRKSTIHGLRHFHATQLMKMGVNPKVVSERLGHSSIEITLNLYTHFQPNMQEDAALQMEKGFLLLENQILILRESVQ
ncbi:MAG: tyrosine-type recombinase/integrase [Bacillota bacterium]|nr:tyrosine-type recombinase/integrase [Bacillota bacterium]